MQMHWAAAHWQHYCPRNSHWIGTASQLPCNVTTGALSCVAARAADVSQDTVHWGELKPIDAANCMQTHPKRRAAHSPARKHAKERHQDTHGHAMLLTPQQLDCRRAAVSKPAVKVTGRPCCNMPAHTDKGCTTTISQASTPTPSRRAWTYSSGQRSQSTA